MSAAYWYRLHFDLRLYEADGSAFQLLVSDVLRGRFNGFVAVSPAGPLGDGGNDGFVPSDGWYFQVYGPQVGSTLRPAAVVSKTRQDFAKLRSNYADLRRYSFVFNDHYRGVPKDVLDALQELQRQTGVRCDAVASRDLADWFMELSEDARQSILRGVPVQSPEWVDPSAVGKVLSLLADAEARFDQTRQRAPDFDEKIRFNGLPSMIADRLRAMSYQCGMVDQFLSVRGRHLAQAIAQELRMRYAASCEKFEDGLGDAPALRYVWLVEQLIPKPARAHPHSLKAYREAAEVVLAKYFESCDIYAQPGPGGRAA